MKIILSNRNGFFPPLLAGKYLQALNKKFHMYVIGFYEEQYRKIDVDEFIKIFPDMSSIFISYKNLGKSFGERKYRTILKDFNNPDLFFNPVFEEGSYRTDETLIRVIEENPSICGNLKVVEVPDGERFIITRTPVEWLRSTCEEIILEKDMEWYPRSV